MKSARQALRRLGEPLPRTTTAHRHSLRPFTSASPRGSPPAAALEIQQQQPSPPPPYPVPGRPTPAVRPEAPAAPATPEAKARAKEVLRDAVAATEPRNDWTREEIAAIYHHPLMNLVHEAVRRAFPPPLPVIVFFDRELCSIYISAELDINLHTHKGELD